MTLPKYIRSALDFHSAVTFHETPESDVLEFKREIDWKAKRAPDGKGLKRAAQKETCRDIAQFANTFGGCMLIGISETSASLGAAPIATAVHALDHAAGLAKWIRQSVANFLVPTTFTFDIARVELPVGAILAVNVPPSLHIVSLWDPEQHTIEYPCRGGDGKRWMNPDEAERHTMDGSRAARIKVESVVNAAPDPKVVELAGGFRTFGHAHEHRSEPRGQVRNALHEHVFELTIPVGNSRHSEMLPYSLVREIWLAAEP